MLYKRWRSKKTRQWDKGALHRDYYVYSNEYWKLVRLTQVEESFFKREMEDCQESRCTVSSVWSHDLVWSYHLWEQVKSFISTFFSHVQTRIVRRERMQAICLRHSRLLDWKRIQRVQMHKGHRQLVQVLQAVLRGKRARRSQCVLPEIQSFAAQVEAAAVGENRRRAHTIKKIATDKKCKLRAA